MYIGAGPDWYLDLEFKLLYIASASSTLQDVVVVGYVVDTAYFINTIQEAVLWKKKVVAWLTI